MHSNAVTAQKKKIPASVQDISMGSFSHLVGAECRLQLGHSLTSNRPQVLRCAAESPQGFWAEQIGDLVQDSFWNILQPRTVQTHTALKSVRHISTFC